MSKIKITATGGAYLKPTPDQFVEIQKDANLSGKLEFLPQGREYDVLYSREIDSHYYIVLPTGSVGVEADRGFIFVGSVALTDTSKRWDIGSDFAGRVVSYMLDKGYKLDDRLRERNIIYIEGVNTDGKANADRLDEWNDLSLIISFKDNKPYLVYRSRATTEPGAHYTYNPMNPGGAFRIAFGQYPAAWVAGFHGRDRQWSLIQVGNVRGHRDKNMDGSRAGDAVVVGSNFGINQHGPYTTDRVGVSSAGCLVRATMPEHERFMRFLTSDEWGDPRYIRDRNFRFSTTVIDGSDFARSKWGYG